MNTQINNILQDLYKIDDSFREHEEELVKIITKLLADKPDTELDDEFVARLRSEILSRAEALGSGAKRPMAFFNLMTLNKFAYAGIGAAVMLLIVLPAALLLVNYSGQAPKLAQEVDLSQPAKIARLDSQAFGTLSAPAAPTGADEVAGRGGGGAASNEAPQKTDGLEAAPVDGLGAGSAEARSGVLPPEYMVNYEFVYTGDELALADSQIPVYRRATDNSLGRSLASTLDNIDFGLVDTDKFRNTEVMVLNLAEDREFGYTVYFNFRDNSLSISTNWETWPQPGADCQDEDCYERIRLTEDDVPDDSRLTAIARQFLSDYGISLDGYGEPYINKHWENRYGLPEESQVYIPDSVPVVFPYDLEGNTAYDESGRPTGMTVEVNIRYNKVAGVHNLYVRNFQRSDYPALTDTARVLQIAENGGLYPRYNYPDARETVTLELGTPETGLVRHWHYDPEQGKGGSELFVQALIFPITNLDGLDRPFHQTHVVVPLAKEIADKFTEQEPPVGIPRPMPLLREEPAPAPAEDMPSIQIEEPAVNSNEETGESNS